MTNHFHAKAVRVGTGWKAYVRYVHKASYAPLMADGIEVVFPTMEQAEIAALRELERHMNSTITGYGDRVRAVRLAAERLFKEKEGVAL